VIADSRQPTDESRPPGVPCIICREPATQFPARPLFELERNLLAARGEGLCSRFECFAHFRSVASQGKMETFVSPEEAEATALAIRKEWVPNPTLEEPADRRELWEAHHAQECDDTRNALVEAYLPLVKSAAQKIHATLPAAAGVDVEELVAMGVFALIDSIKRFNLARGVKFEVFALQRVRGAMYDELRAIDPAGRTRQQQLKELEEAEVELSHTLSRSPTGPELAVRLGVAPQEIERRRELQRRLHVERINPPTAESRQPKAESCFNPRIRVEHVASLRRVTRGLEKPQRLIVIGYYYLGRSMRQIGEDLGVSESRISQMHSEIIEQLRASGRFEELIRRPRGERKQCRGEPWGATKETRVVESQNGHADPLGAALSFLAAAGEEELEVITSRIGALEVELAHLRVLRSVIAKNEAPVAPTDRKKRAATRRPAPDVAAIDRKKPGWLLPTMEQVLRERGAMTAEQLAAAAGASTKGVRTILTRKSDRFALRGELVSLAE
jgi:RNA polymerase sigma factor for flagellar operon FliA